MRGAMGTKALLVVIALGVWALTMTQVSTPAAMAHGEETSYSAGVRHAPAGEASSPPEASVLGAGAPRFNSPAATLPLRWQVGYARHISLQTTHCGTSIAVTVPLDISHPDIQVEWINDVGSALDMQSVTAAEGVPGRVWVFTANTDIVSPLSSDKNSALVGIFEGSARIHSSDPRILVSAFMYCRTGTGVVDLVSVVDLPTFPVGATLEYFRAGLPATPTPLVAEPELPEDKRLP